MKIGIRNREQGRKYSEIALQLLLVLTGLRCAILAIKLPLGSDALAYLDLARAYLRHDWSTAVNGYWGPLYPLLIAGWFKVVHPRAAQEVAAVCVLNFFIFLLCFYSFLRLWRAIAQWQGSPGESDFPLPNASPLAWMLFGYVLFVVHTLWYIGSVGPDILVASVVLLISARMFELHARTSALVDNVGLGLLIAVGFFTKAILFYFGLAVLGSLFVGSLLRHGFRSRRYQGPLTAALVCVLMVSPYVMALSRVLGRFSVGETGRLSYAWYIDGTEPGDWVNGGASFPFFPGAVALASPRVFRIPRLPGVTYAPWYDAARFDKRSRAYFDARGQLRQISINLKSLSDEILGRHSALLVCLLILASVAPAVFLRRLAAAWFCVIPALVVVGMYLLVHLVGRFMIGFSLVIWGVLFSSIRVPARYEALMRRALACGIAVFAACTLPGIAHLLISQPQNLIQRELVIAEALPGYGIRPGDGVGLIGDGQVAAWAHWAGVSIMAEVAAMDSASFWSASPASQQAVVSSMAALGAKAVIWQRDSDRPCPQDWTGLPADSGCIIQCKVPTPLQTGAGIVAQTDPNRHTSKTGE